MLARRRAFCGLRPPEGYGGLDVGTHRFSVRQRDLAGNTGPAATYEWEILEDGSTNAFVAGTGPADIPIGPNGGVDCAIAEGALKSCEVTAYIQTGGAAGVSRRVKIGRGKKRVRTREDVQRTTVKLKLNKRGRRALAQNPFGLEITLDVAAQPFFLERLRETREATLLARSFLIVPRFGLLDGARGSLSSSERRYLRRIAGLISGDARKVRCESRQVARRRARRVCRFLGRRLADTRVTWRRYASGSPGVQIRVFR